jgi:hypothetical protein
LGGRGRQISEFEASLVYRLGSRTAKATQRNSVSKNQKNQNKTKNYLETPSPPKKKTHQTKINKMKPTTLAKLDLERNFLQLMKDFHRK